MFLLVVLALAVNENGIKVVSDDFMLATAADMSLIPPLLMLLLKELWKEKIGTDGGIVRERLVEKLTSKVNTLVDQEH